MKIFETFKCSGQNSSNSSCQLWNDKSVPPQILRNSSLSWQITPLWILSSYFFKFGIKHPIKIPILSALEKICHIPHVIFQTTSQSKVMLDKSVNNLDSALLVWSYPNSSYDFGNLEPVLYKFCSIL